MDRRDGTSREIPSSRSQREARSERLRRLEERRIRDRRELSERRVRGYAGRPYGIVPGRVQQGTAAYVDSLRRNHQRNIRDMAMGRFWRQPRQQPMDVDSPRGVKRKLQRVRAMSDSSSSSVARKRRIIRVKPYVHPDRGAAINTPLPIVTPSRVGRVPVWNRTPTPNRPAPKRKVADKPYTMYKMRRRMSNLAPYDREPKKRTTPGSARSASTVSTPRSLNRSFATSRGSTPRAGVPGTFSWGTTPNYSTASSRASTPRAFNPVGATAPNWSTEPDPTGATKGVGGANAFYGRYRAHPGGAHKGAYGMYQFGGDRNPGIASWAHDRRHIGRDAIGGTLLKNAYGHSVNPYKHAQKVVGSVKKWDRKVTMLRARNKMRQKAEATSRNFSLAHAGLRIASGVANQMRRSRIRSERISRLNKYRGYS